MKNNINKETKIDKFHYHEILDRTYIIEFMLDEHLLNHPVVQKHSILKKKLKKISSKLADVYQIVGNLCDNENFYNE